MFSQQISPQTRVVDINTIDAAITLDFENQEVSGQLKVTFTMLKDASQVLLDAHHMEIEDKTDLFEITATDAAIIFKNAFKAGKRYEAVFNYSVKPTQAAYFVNNGGETQFWTQGQGKYTSHWLPSIDDMNDKIIFNITEHQKTATPQGDQYKNRVLSQELIDKPISSYLVALVSGNYNTSTETSASGIPLAYYYYPEDSLKVASTYRYSKEIFDFLEDEIGVPYPWDVYKQVPVKDFLYAGMENASLTLFSDSFVVDEIGFVDRNYVNVNAHELAHQWFGDLVTETKSEHHWLHEGFATYYALLAEREIFGDDYFYFRLFETAEQLRELSDAGKGQKLVAAGGSSLTYYQKGAWALHILREKVGEDIFAKAIKNYLIKFQYKNVTTADFMSEVKAVTDVDLTAFEKNWLYQSAFQAEDALNALKKSDFMADYFALQSLRRYSLAEKGNALMSAIRSGNDYLGQEGVYQLSGEDSRSTLPFYKAAFGSDSVVIRQAVATSLDEIPNAILNDFKTLLKDKSYITQEQAFLKLWVHYRGQEDFKSQRALLDEMENIVGLGDGNIKTLWLTLSLATPDYKPQESRARYEDLIALSAAEHPFQLRENAFNYLAQLDSFEKNSLQNLVEASVHHVWRFRESARKLLELQLKKPENISLLQGMKPTFSEKEVAYLKRIEVF